MSTTRYPQTDSDGTRRDEAAKRAASQSAKDNARVDAELQGTRSSRSKRAKETQAGRKDMH
jgi:hypothetical protein